MNSKEGVEEKNSDKFRRMRYALSETYDKELALKQLDELLAIPSEEMLKLQSDALCDLRKLFGTIFDILTIKTLFDHPDVLILSIIKRSPPLLVDFIANYISKKIGAVEGLLCHSHIEILFTLCDYVIEEACVSVRELLSSFLTLEPLNLNLYNLLKRCEKVEERIRIYDIMMYYLGNDGESRVINRFLVELSKEIISDDLLLQTVLIQMLTDAIYDKPNTAVVLRDWSFIDKLYHLLRVVISKEIDTILYPSLVKFFGNLSINYINWFEKYLLVIKSVYDCMLDFENINNIVRTSVFNAYAAIGSTVAGRNFLVDLEVKHSELNISHLKAMEVFGKAVASGQLEVRAHHIVALNMLFTHRGNEERASNELMRIWYENLGEGFSAMLVSNLKKPFDDIRIPNTELVGELVKYDWMVEKIFITPEFFTTIINRRLELSIIGMHLKYEIICKLIDLHLSRIEPGALEKLQTYRRQGVCYKELTHEVALEL